MSDLPTMLRVRCTSGRSDERDIVCRAADELERLEALAPPMQVADTMDAFPSDVFTMVESEGATFLMRGKICFAEIREQDGAWRVWGYGLDSYVGPFPSAFDAGRAAVKSAWTTLEAASLALSTSNQTAKE